MWLVGSAVFLLLVIAAYLGAAHHLRHHWLATLPAKLGVNVVSDASGWTYSPSIGSKTPYRIHAAKQVGYADGKFTLHDVSVMLYGEKSDRRDHIFGQDFEYDQKAGVIRALGVVHIDLQAADATGSGPAANASAKPEGPEYAESGGAKVMHVTTSGLVYLENLGLASTNDPIEFQAGAMIGHATGADYSSDSGLLTLHSAVSMSGMSAGRPVTVTAATAEFNERSQQAFLTHAQYDSTGRTVNAEQATLQRRADGTLARVEAQGNVTIREQGATTVSQRADVALNGTSQPRSAVLAGGVLYTLDEPLRQARGHADEATIAFDTQAKPQPERAVFTGAVHTIERTRATEAEREPWSVRDLTAAKLEVELARTGEGKLQPRDAEATGDAHLTVIDNGSLAGDAGTGRKDLSADDLKAHLRDTGNAKQPPQLDTLAGRGHTVLRQVSANGVEETSSGDTLDAKFRPAAGKRRAGAGAGTGAGAGAGNGTSRRGAEELGTASLASAVQQGHVTMMRRVPAKSGRAAGATAAGDDVEHARAERAAYDGDTDRMTLTGGVQVSDAGSVLWANQVALDRASGDSVATGAVKVDYVQSATGRTGTASAGAARGASESGSGSRQGAEPTHILAERAELEYATKIATFHGKPVRLWQGADQVQAPVIEIAQQQQRLIARSEAGTGWSAAQQAAQVRTVLSQESDEAGTGTAGAGKHGSVAPGCANTGAKAGAGSAGAAAQGANVIRIASGGLVFSGILNQADFTGGFRADTADGTIRANAGTAYLRPARPESPVPAGSSAAGGVAAGGGAAAVPSLTGRLERVVATGHVDIQQPGVRATGERLVYTANDQVFLLTGDSKNPPQATDANGTTTAAALRFHNTCDAGGGVSVEALGEVPGEPAQRVHTESRILDEKNKASGKK
jgi:lipopolysaccharide export system protein LptA